MKPHKHADLIKAWLDGEPIQYRRKEHFTNGFNFQPAGEWCDKKPYEEASLIQFDLDVYDYRMKTESKSDSIYTYHVQWGPRTNTPHWHQSALHNLKLIFDGETGKLKSAEVIND